jgi:hypothetical protein
MKKKLEPANKEQKRLWRQYGVHIVVDDGEEVNTVRPHRAVPKAGDNGLLTRRDSTPRRPKRMRKSRK